MQQEETPNNKQTTDYIHSSMLTTIAHLKDIDIRPELDDIRGYLRHYSIANYGKRPTFIITSYYNKSIIIRYLIRSGVACTSDFRKVIFEGVTVLSSEDLEDNELIIA